MTNLATEREITKYFAMASINVKPDACKLVLDKIQKQYVFADEKRQFMTSFLKYFKEWQTLSQKNKQVVSSSTAVDHSILDSQTAQKIISMMAASNRQGSQNGNSLSPQKRQSAPFAQDSQFEPAQQKKPPTSFKQRKKEKRQEAETFDKIMTDDPEAAEGHREDDDEEMKRQILDAQRETRERELEMDKILVEVKGKNVYLNDFQQFPKMIINNQTGGINFAHYSKHQKIRDVNASRMEYFAQRLAQAEDRIFSHPDKYSRAKLYQSDSELMAEGQIVVNKIHSIIGSQKTKWVLGIIGMREDGQYYLEDDTYAIKIGFQQIQHVESDCYFTENCVVLARGCLSNEMFMLQKIMHPPLFANKSEKFKMNEEDYFGSYIKMSEQVEAIFTKQNQRTAMALKVQQELESLTPCVIVVNQPELDQARNMQCLKTLLTGLDSMRPEVIVMIGNFVSSQSTETHTYDQVKSYFDEIFTIVKDNELDCLKELTQWIFMPSLNDAGICKVMPSFKLSEHFASGLKGNGPNRLKKVMLATNPMRMSFRGKEMVFCRFDYFKKLRKNHIDPLHKQQEKQRQEEAKELNIEVGDDPLDHFKIVKTVLHQGSLLPLAPIVQPVLWTYADSLHLHPHPDFLILADDCKDYYYEVPVNGHDTTSYQAAGRQLGNEEGHKVKTIHVANPGNFGKDRNFTVIYPDSQDGVVVEPSKV